MELRIQKLLVSFFLLIGFHLNLRRIPIFYIQTKTVDSNDIDLMNLRNCAKFAKRWNLNAVFESLFELNMLPNFDEACEIYKIIFDEAKAAEIIQIQIEPQPKILIKHIPKISDAALFFILYFSKINGIVKIAIDPANDEYSIYEHVS